MNSHRSILPLLRFQLQLLPMIVWLLLAFFLFHVVMFMIIMAEFTRGGGGEVSGINTSLNLMPIMFCGILGMQIIAGSTGWAGSVSTWLMPAGEFLLVRPIPRSTAYLSRVFLLLAVMLASPLLKLGLSLSTPDLEMSLFHSKTQSTEAFDRLSFYQNQFPDSLVVRKAKATHDTLVIPHGSLLISLWEFWLVLLIALALQVTTLLPPFKGQVGILMGVCMSPLLFTTVLDFAGKSTPVAENAFFFFVHYCGTIGLASLGAFALIQWIALIRIQDVEVI